MVKNTQSSLLKWKEESPTSINNDLSVKESI